MEHATDPAFGPCTGRAFPGGKVRLPRLNAEDRGTQPTIDVVDTAFLGGGTATIADEPDRAGFTGYFTYESLFDDPEETNDPAADGEDPYAVLRVNRSDAWPIIVTAHRALVKEFHPDRFAGQSPELLAEAEVEIKRINLAYDRLRRERAAEGTERRSGTDRRER